MRESARPTNRSARHAGTIAGSFRLVAATAVLATGWASPLPPETSTTSQPCAPGGLVDVDESWWKAVTSHLSDAEYAATATSAGLQAPNRAHDLRTTFGERGIAVEPRVKPEVAPRWQFSWETSSFGRTGHMTAVVPATPESEGTLVTYPRDGWSEWYENTPKGLEQGFTIERRPEGEGPLRIAGRFPASLHAVAREDGAIDFLDGNGACAIRYGALHSWDANGVTLASKLVVSKEVIEIVVHDQSAAYPLTIDPPMTSPNWTAESDQANAFFGSSVATAGDVNGDGFSDVIVGAPEYDHGETNEGRAFVYHGSASGLSFTPNWTAESNQANSEFGFSVATAGDVNGDGFSDVIVGAYGYGNGETGEGRAFLYHGSAGGLSVTPNWTAESDQPYAIFGHSAATAGDVNGDGYSDVIVGANQYDNGEAYEGRAFVYHGSASGLSFTPNWIAESNHGEAFFGFSVATAGDVNGDGFSDVIVGAPGESFYEGRAFVYHGSAVGLATTPAWTAADGQEEALFGFSVATAGDVNGDGFSDVIVGARDDSNGQVYEGRAFVYHGSVSGLGTAPGWTAESNQADAGFGFSVATAGDVNGDGFSDVIVGARGYDNDEGRAFVYLGSDAGLASTAAWTGESNQSSANFGRSVATAGDVNGDGFSDVIVGAYGYDNGESNEGRAFVYHGSGAGLASTAAWTGESNQSTAYFGRSAIAGDVNGDGFSDVIVGAYQYDDDGSNEGWAFVYHGSAGGLSTSPDWIAEGDQTVYFGSSVATAGDVNGDGFSDVIVGAPLTTNGENFEGRAFVYHGSAAGLAAAPAWTTESNQADAAFGISVATAGDVNGDGYSDVIVGAWRYDNGETDEGRTFVYHGSAAGLAATPAWTAESNQASAAFGFSVATAGDVNGDGFSDIIVGAYQYDNGETNEGRAFVFHGSAAGLATTPAWTAESNQFSALFGISVAAAGDVNGDRFSDVIVGADVYDNGQADEGRAFVYQGSAAGLAATPAWTAESNQDGAKLGHSAGTAGDVNGDGFSDVIVGAYIYDNGEVNEGRAFAYHGSAAGLAATPAWTAESNQANAFLGISVATAGDVNGDGFSDVIVGAEFYDNGEGDEGGAFVYLGNEQVIGMEPLAGVGGAASDRIPRQVRTDDTAPIAILGASDSESAFRLKVLGRTPSGRGRVRLQAEVKPAGVPFDGTGLLVGPPVDTGTPGEGGSSVLLSELAGGLAPATLYHWRLRVLGDSPFFPSSPWLWLPGNAVTEPDLRTAEPSAGAESSESPAAGLQLTVAAPNPFASAARFAYTLPQGGRHRLAIFDAQGREVSVLVDDIRSAGRYVGRWDGRDARGSELSSGVYFLRLESNGHVATRKVVIAR